MSKYAIVTWWTLALLTAGVAAQTTVTTSAPTSSGAVPVFNGTATVTNSPITVSGSSVGVGTGSPDTTLDVYTNTTDNTAGGIHLHGSDGSLLRLYSSLGWGNFNPLVQAGDAAILYSTGSSGGFVVGPWSTSSYGLRISSTGNVGIGTPTPGAVLDVHGVDTSPQVSGAQISTPTFPQLLLNASGGGSNAKLWRVIGRGTNDFEIQTLNDSYSGEVTAFQINRSGTSITNVLFPNGSVGIGTTSPGAKLEVNGGLRFTSDPSGTVQTTAWTGVLCGGDYAESVDVTGDRSHYEPGDVLVIDPDAPGKFLRSAEPYSTSVTGIYSTKPGAVGRRLTGLKSADEVPMAMIGIVPTKVSAENGPIHPGDLLVTSSTIGYAMKGTDRSLLTGAVIGKALGNLDSGKGEIEVVVTLQ